MKGNAIYTIAETEVIVGVRNKWTHIFTLIFTILVLGISYFGLSASGYTGSMQDFSRTTLSLLNLVLYIIPLVSLVIGVISFSSDGRFNELIFAQPLNRWEIYIGKLLGLMIIIFSSMALGFGISGFIILFRVGSEGVFRYFVFVLLSNLLAFIFLGISAFISALAKQRGRAFGISILVWFTFLIFYDLVIIGATTLLRGKLAAKFAMISLLGNPVDIVRVLSLITLNSPEIFGPAGAAFLKFLGGSLQAYVVLILVLLLWFIFSVFLAVKIFSKQDIT
ncbi:Cu-processing system permease protein [Candidatus Kryptonium thompsonii]|uniref:Cu-processing system permease protein n=1 Tax=Candidatus Kryptonium thompsonii TaxID=1633631 RepID=A0A0P1LP76_9BACT|nr:ABC transporter permease [Candidatus Kryptonium thompsoni]CUS78053.1 Cu-processing system permease protein [Candidatus Kryptonium thompsoni]CUS78967.1 Cu-processing system permease protein [Candidatus Kryptonium thompsoni]CUS83440.1 Cu-processing system permease protein [Candidatus Kryptonium thompsoni]CUS84746.1 Cu-processing system permease protein [Candidatus Kryptonium thompsoni]CUS85776.1 Cu-processing system permease protein [Candidatus Kryptonium thompsoni]